MKSTVLAFGTAMCLATLSGLGPWCGGAASAATINQITISNGCTSDGLGELINRSSDDGSQIGAAASGTDTRNGCSNSGQATAGGGLISLYADSSTAGGGDPRQYGGSITVRGSSRISGFTLSGPGQSVNVALAFDITGTAGGNVVDGILPSSFLSSFRYSIVVSGGQEGPQILDATVNVGDSGGNEECPPQGCSQSAPGRIQTGFFTWNSADTLIVDIGLVGTATTGAYEYGTADAEVDLSSTLNFAARDAFVLPDGYFVTNAEANILNNDWIDPRDAPAPIPLPPGLPLLAGSFAILWLTKFTRASRFSD